MPVKKKKTIGASEYKALRDRVDTVRRDRDRAAGQLDALMERLRDEFGCNTLEEAEKYEATLAAEVDRTAKALQHATAEFETKWGDYVKD